MVLGFFHASVLVCAALCRGVTGGGNKKELLLSWLIIAHVEVMYIYIYANCVLCGCVPSSSVLPHARYIRTHKQHINGRGGSYRRHDGDGNAGIEIAAGCQPLSSFRPSSSLSLARSFARPRLLPLMKSLQTQRGTELPCACLALVSLSLSLSLHGSATT